MTFQSSNDLYGFPQPLTSVFPASIKSLRAPATSDNAEDTSTVNWLIVN